MLRTNSGFLTAFEKSCLDLKKEGYTLDETAALLNKRSGLAVAMALASAERKQEAIDARNARKRDEIHARIAELREDWVAENFEVSK
jgi:DNA-binding transcriptional MerR regulator